MMASRATIRTTWAISPIAAYLFAHFAKSLVWHSSILLFAFYLTEACGLSPYWAGVTLGGSLVANGMADLVVGWWKGRSITNAADAAQFQQAGALVVAGSFAVFCAASLLPGRWCAPAAITSLIVFRLTYPILDLAQNALLSLGRCPDGDRFRLVAWRTMAGGLSVLAVATLVAPTLVTGAGVTQHFAGLGVVMATLLVVSAYLLRIEPNTAALFQAVEPTDRTMSSAAFGTALVMIALTGFSGALFRKLEAYYGAFGNGSAGASVTLMVAVAVGTLVSQPIWLIAQRRFGTANIVIASGGVTILAAGLFLMTLGQASDAGVGVLFGAGLGGTGLMLWSIVAVVGVNDRPMARFGLFTCVSKLSQGAGAATLGALLGGVDYRHVMAMPGNSVLLAMVLVPMGAALACMMLAHAARDQLK